MPEDNIKDEERRRTAVHHGIRWSWAVLSQAARVREAQDAVVRSRPTATSTHYGNEERVPFLRMYTEIHFFLNAARNLMRAVSLLDRPDSAPAMVPAPMSKHLTTLRDCFEHWDEAEHAEDGKRNRGRAYRDFAALKQTEEHADLPDEPSRHSWSVLGTTIGGLRLEEIEALAHRLHTYFLDLEATTFVWRGWTAVPATKV